ncbi:hypothetical protein P5673_003997 [Acropora cervicornis]|uniref:Uncharacterized protein n=1 Tax=Acropora cervicornis TaxID=6130 RepID=A0AAD9R1L0_ACRCE|nr:hypothetical protein P5673_003997 [Acropora cervicornis]
MEIYTKRSQKSSKKKGRYSFKMQMEDERKIKEARKAIFREEEDQVLRIGDNAKELADGRLGTTLET